MYQFHMMHLNFTLTECFMSIISQLKKIASWVLDSVIFTRKVKPKILSHLNNPATRWQQITSDGTAPHLGLLEPGYGGVKWGVLRP